MENQAILTLRDNINLGEAKGFWRLDISGLIMVREDYEEEPFWELDEDKNVIRPKIGYA